MYITTPMSTSVKSNVPVAFSKYCKISQTNDAIKGIITIAFIPLKLLPQIK